MIAVMKEEKNRIHPHKFTLWIALASIVMMFTGFTSAYIVKRNLANWITFELPEIFWYSTAVIIISSLTIMLSRNYFRQREMKQYRLWLAITLVLGIVFVLYAIHRVYPTVAQWCYTYEKCIIFIFIYNSWLACIACNRGSNCSGNHYW